MLRADGLAPAPFAARREEAATCARPPSPRLWFRVGGEITHEPHMDRNTKTSLTKLRKVSSPISLRSPSKAHLPALGGGSLVRCTARPSAWPPSAVSGPQPPPFLLASARPPSFGEVLSATLGPYGLRLAVPGRGLTSPWIPPLRPPPYPHKLRRSTPHWPVVTLQRGEAAPKARSHGARGQKHTRLENRDRGAHSCKGRSRQLPMLVNPDLRR